MRREKADGSREFIGLPKMDEMECVAIMVSYSKEDIIKMTRDALKTPETLYQQPFINYCGSVDGVRYTEIAAEEILKNIDMLYSIPCITREASYKTERHSELAKEPKTENSNREEELIAIDMYGKELDHIGTIVDYQVPLKNKETDKAGKIDLLSYSQGWWINEYVEYESKAYVVELKKPESTDTLLRCVLEAFTYRRTVNAPKLRSDFNMFPNTPLIPAVLIFDSCQAYEDFKANSLYSIMIKGLMWELGVELYSISDVPIRAFNNICSISYFAKNWGEDLGLGTNISDPNLLMTYHIYYNIELSANELMSHLIKEDGIEHDKVAEWYGNLDTMQIAYNTVSRVTPNDSEEQICAIIKEEVSDPTILFIMREYAKRLIDLQKRLGLRKD